MRLVFGLIMSVMVGIMMATCVRKTEWMKDRQEKIFAKWCENKGGRPKMLSIWRMECEIKTDDRGNIIRP